MTTRLFQCFVCRHLRKGRVNERPTCAAFPDGIPLAVLTTRRDHRKPITGDHGIRFEASEGHTHPQHDGFGPRVLVTPEG